MFNFVYYLYINPLQRINLSDLVTSGGELAPLVDRDQNAKKAVVEQDKCTRREGDLGNK